MKQTQGGRVDFPVSPSAISRAELARVPPFCVLTAQLLEQNLVAKAASVAPSPDPEAQARYEQARRSLLNQLQASANLS